jgi:hypothetical protein
MIHKLTTHITHSSLAVDYTVNLERNRSVGKDREVYPDACNYVAKAASSPALKANPNNRLVVIDCGGWWFEVLHTWCSSNSEDYVHAINDQVMIASYSQTTTLARPGDVGIPTPALKPVDLTVSERELLQNCTHKRRYLFSFQGTMRKGREGLSLLNNGEDMYVQMNGGQSSEDFKGLLKTSTFGAVPRGDGLFSYRFAETLSAGTIPVIYANDWLAPFDSAVVNWTNCAIFIREKDMNQTAEILRAIPPETVCDMQQKALQVYDAYVSSRLGWLNGLVQSVLVKTAEPIMT